MTLKAMRINRNLTQKQAAKEIGVSKSTFGKWERGICYPDVMQLKKIENAYGITYEDIIFLPFDDALSK